MLKLLYPAEYAESVFTIDYDRVYALGYRGLVFDIDNTLVPHGKPSTPEVDAFFAGLKARGFQTLLLSDNYRERVASFAENTDALTIHNARKPRPGAFRRAVKMLGLDRRQVLCVGDQIFTDVLGANLAGLDSVLVKYIGYYEPGNKGKRRAAEAKVLSFYEKSRYHNRLGITGDAE